MITTTVVIPNYDGISYLRDCMDSLDAAYNTNGEFEVVVVDNGSHDGSAGYIEELRKSREYVRLIKLADNTGFAYAVNQGIEAVNTEYVILLNNDITIEKDFVKKLEEAIASSDDIFSVNSVMRQMSDTKLLDGMGDYYCALGWAFAAGKDKEVAGVIKPGELRPVFSACAGAAIYRKKILDEIGLFDEAHFAYLEDVDIGYRARIKGYRNMVCTDAICDHAGSASSGSRYNEFKVKLASRNSIYIIYKNMPLLQILINMPFFLIGYAIKMLFFLLKGFGGTYITGLAEGVALCFTKKGRAKKVRFDVSNTGSYIRIQIELWLNMFRRITG